MRPLPAVSRASLFSDRLPENVWSPVVDVLPIVAVPLFVPRTISVLATVTPPVA